VSPGHSFILKSVGTKSEACHAANITRKVKEHISRNFFEGCMANV